MSSIIPINRRINDNLFKIIFSPSENKRPFSFDKNVLSFISKKTKNTDVVYVIRKQYNEITIPYVYKEISHLKKILIDLYYPIVKIIFNRNNTTSYSSNQTEYKTYIEFRRPLKIFDIKKDFYLLFDALFFCLRKTNTNYYKIYKKFIGKRHYYAVFKVVINDVSKYILCSCSVLENEYKFTIEDYYGEDYDAIKRDIKTSSISSLSRSSQST